MPQTKSGLECPLCAQGGVIAELMADQLRTTCSSNPEHFWTDRSELMAMQPRFMAKVARPDTVQAQHVPLQLNVPESVKKLLEARYGDKLPTSLTSVLQACAEPEMMLLNATDLQRITERLGQKPTSSGELFGMMFALGEELKSARSENELLLRRMNIKRGDAAEGVVIDLAEYMSKAVAKAADAGVPLEEFLSKYLRDSLENDWITS